MKRENWRVFLFGLIITIGAIFFVQTGYAESIKKAILGNWNIIGSRETIEFFEDGTIILDSKEGSLVGDYRFLDENRIRIDLGGIAAMAGSQVARISKVNDRITLDKLFDQKIELKKVTEALQIYLNGLALYDQKKFFEAAVLIEKAAKLGEPEAQNLLSYMYYNGTGIEKNYQRAFEWSFQAANQGVVSSQRLLGYMYQKGYGTEQNIEKSISWFEKAAEQNDLISLSGLAWIYATSADRKYWEGDKALKYAQRAYSHSTDKWFIFSSLAAAYARIGQFDKAEDNCKQAMRLLSWDNSLSKEQREKELEEAEILLGLYQSGQAYDESYDLDQAVAKRKEELKKVEAERKKAEEEARKKKRQEYEKRLAEQEKRQKELEEQRKKEVEQKKQKAERTAALKSEYMKPTKTLSTFELVGTNNIRVRGEIKDTEIIWMTQYLSAEEYIKGIKIMRKGRMRPSVLQDRDYRDALRAKKKGVEFVPKSQLPEDVTEKILAARDARGTANKSNWKEMNLWFGKINKVQIIDRSAPRASRPSKYSCFSLQINSWDIICGDKSEIQRLYNELINAISLWYDKYAEVNPKRPNFLSRSSNITGYKNEQPPNSIDKILVANI